MGKNAFGEGQEGKLGEFRQTVYLFPPPLLSCLLLVVANLQKVRILLVKSIFLRFGNFFPSANNISSFFGRFS